MSILNIVTAEAHEQLREAYHILEHLPAHLLEHLPSHAPLMRHVLDPLASAFTNLSLIRDHLKEEG